MNTDNISINIHSSIKVNGSKVIYFDPYEIVDESHDADVIFITHKHYDHFDPASLVKISKEDTIYVFPASIKDDFFSTMQVDEEWCELLAPYDEVAIDDLEVRGVPSYNTNKPNHLKEFEWLGYVVVMDGVSYYVAGDTDVNDDIEKVECDVALVPIGGTYTMDYKEAASYIARICPKVCIPTHYGSIVGKTAYGDKFLKLVRKTNDNVEVILKL